MPIVNISGKLFDVEVLENGSITRKEYFPPEPEPIKEPITPIGRPAFLVYMNDMNMPTFQDVSKMDAQSLIALLGKVSA